MDTPNGQSGQTHSANIIEATDANFDTEVINHSGPVLVDVWAEWCTPCHMLAPHIDAIADALPGKLKVVMLDSDFNQQTAIKYNILSLPTLLLIQDGMVIGQQVGFRPKQAILQWLQEKGVDITPVAQAA